MKELFVLYGRVDWNDGIFSVYDNEYFGESPVLELFEDYASAYERFELYVKKAHQNFFECPYLMMNEACAEKASRAEIFADYNMGRDEYPSGDVQWTFQSKPEMSALWQMYAVNIDTVWCPILPGLYIAKKTVNS